MNLRFFVLFLFKYVKISGVVDLKLYINHRIHTVAVPTTNYFVKFDCNCLIHLTRIYDTNVIKDQEKIMISLTKLPYCVRLVNMKSVSRDSNYDKKNCLQRDNVANQRVEIIFSLSWICKTLEFVNWIFAILKCNFNKML